METFTPPPYREKRPPGRQPKHSVEFRLMVGKKVIEQDLSYREAAKTFDMSTGAVGCCVKLYRDKDIGPNRKKRYKERNIEAENYRHEAQIKDLKLQVADLFLETQMLKKILNKSLQIKKENGSMITSENWDRSVKDAE